MAEGVNLFDLAAKISLDSKGVDSSLTATQKKVLALADQFKKTEVAASQTNKGMGSGVLSLEKQLASVASLERQRQAARLKDFLSTERAAKKTAAETARAAKQAATAFEKDVGGAIQNVSPQIAALAGSGGPITLAVAGFLALAAAGAAAVYGLFQFATSSSESAGKLYDLEQQLNLSADTLSGFSILARQSGTSIEQLSAGMGIFDKKVEEVAQGNKQLGKTFKQLKIDSNDTEVALRQALTALGNMKNPTQQVAMAMDLFGRSGKSMLGVLKQADGDIDGAIKRFKEMGAVLDEDAIRKADEFNDKMVVVSAQLDTLKIRIGMALLPTIESAMNQVSDLLTKNQTQVSVWARAVGGAAYAAAWPIQTVLLRALHDVTAVLEYLASRKWVISYSIISVGGALLPVPTGLTGTKDQFYGVQGGTTGVGPRGREPITGGGGGGGGGDPAAAAKRLAELRLQAQLIGLKFEEEANKRSLDRQWQDFDQYRVRFVSTENARHKAVVDGLAEEMAAAEKVRKVKEREIAIQTVRNKQQQEEYAFKKNIASVNDQQAALLDQLNDFLANQVKQIGFARAGTDQYDQSVLDLEEALKKAGFAEVERWHAILMQNAATQRAIDLTKSLTRERRVLSERPRSVTDEVNARLLGIDLSKGDETRTRRTTDDFKERMRPVAEQLTSLISTSIHDGFKDGVARGAIEFAQGVLQMIESKALNRLTDAILDALVKGFSGAQSSGGTSGGGFLGFLSKWILPLVGAAVGGAVGGGIGSHSSAIGHGGTGGIGGGGVHSGSLGNLGGLHSFAVGTDFVPFDMLAMIHRGEKITPAAENRSGQAGHTFVFNYHAPTGSKVESRETVRQASDKYRKFMQHAALTG